MNKSNSEFILIKNNTDVLMRITFQEQEKLVWRYDCNTLKNT